MLGAAYTCEMLTESGLISTFLFSCLKITIPRIDWININVIKIKITKLTIANFPSKNENNW